MNKLEALKILSEITAEESMEMKNKIDQASRKIRKRNPQKAEEERSLKWRSRNTRCPSCGGIHVGFRCPIGS